MPDNTDVALELIRTLGNAFKELSARIEKLDKDGIKPDDIAELRKLATNIEKMVKENQQMLHGDLASAITAFDKINCENCPVNKTIMSWSSFWNKLISARAIAVYILILVLTILGLLETYNTIHDFKDKTTQTSSQQP